MTGSPKEIYQKQRDELKLRIFITNIVDERIAPLKASLDALKKSPSK